MIKREIPIKNYIKYLIIIFISIISCIILYTIYNNKLKDTPILRNIVREIDIKDVDNYIIENESVLLYFGVVNDKDSEKIEKAMIKEMDIDNINIVYVNITELSNKKKYLREFSDKYSKLKKVTTYPAFVYIKNKEIIDVIERDDRELVIENVINFVDTNEIKGEKNA